METLSTRVLTSVVGFVIVSAIVWIGWWAMLPALIAVSFFGLHEYFRMLDRNDLDVRRLSVAIFGAALIVASLPLFSESAPWPGGSWREVVLTIAVGALLVLEVVRPGERPLERVVYSLFGLL